MKGYLKNIYKYHDQKQRTLRTVCLNKDLRLQFIGNFTADFFGNEKFIVVKIMIFLVHAVHLSSKFVLDLYKLDIFQCFPVACCTWQYGRENSNGNA